MDIVNDSQITSGPSKPCESLWFSDGNVVIATNTLLFKVHKGVLSLRSSVFKDMFEFPAVNSGSNNVNDIEGTIGTIAELYEGLPMVTLAGDKGEDVAHLLKATYEPHYFRPDRNEASLETVIALLTLSTKYDFKHVQRDIVFHIARRYPMSLEKYEDIKEINIYGGQKEDELECHFKLLKAVFIAGIDFLLPQLYYACSDSGIGDILRGSRTLRFDQKCFDTLLEGKERIEGISRTLIARIPENAYREHASNPCTTDHDYGGFCLEKIRFNSLEDLYKTADLRFLSVGHVTERCATPLCESCREVVEYIVDGQREAIWDCIPICFGFPDWDVLQVKMDEFL
ncbi:hypothetical protein SCHPADRAFT_910540 [Schizopora paradoxa]|uniref:BTB domain-containing protein n=1 Tax=Schizopora paradoxa TaxID=27342 RepID=A0A0H2R460_9AGAM|nr:hypothetical protein SCHPADRAFT_910540 [Schizopora paradoxa]